MTPRERKAAMVLAGVRPIDIARKLGVSPTTVGTVLAGRCTSRRVFEAVAEAIGKPVEEVFPKQVA